MVDPFVGSDVAGEGAMLIALSVLVKATLILGAAWLLQRLFRRTSAAVRHGVWAAALLAVVALPAVTLWLPALDVELSFLPVESARPATPPAVTPSLPQLLPADVSPAESPTRVPSVGEPVASPAPDATSGARATIRWPIVAVLLWASGVALRLLWLLLQFARVRRLSGSARPETHGALAGRVRELTGALGIRRSVSLLESARVSMPLTWGTLRPVILLPSEAREWPEGRLRVVLLHELAHIRRWDYLTYLLAEIACAAYWPIPLVWLARRRVQVEQEQACDDLVLASGTGSLEYAEHLLGVARAFYGNRWELGATVSMAREISLKDRIRTILDDRTDRGPLLSGSGLLVLLLLSAVTLPVAAMRPSAETAAAGDAEVGPEASGPPAAAPAPAPTEPSPTEEPADAPVFLWLESEDGVASGPMVVREDLDASSGAYLVVPDGRGNDAPDGGPGQVRFSVEVPRTGEYYLWGRVLGAHGNDNSVHVSVDGSAEMAWHMADERGELFREWGWLPLGAPEGAARPMPLHLGEGTRTLRIRNREDGTRLDRLLITTDPAYVPSGRGPTVVPRPAYRWIEGEGAHLTGAIQRVSEDEASASRAITFHRGRGSESAGVATFSFDVESPGRYVLWGRVLAPGEEANSFFVSVDGGAEVIWDAPERDPGRQSGRWSWSALGAREYEGRRVDPLLLDLRPGRHEIRFRTREPGIRLDGVLITNDLAFRPRGVWPAALPTRPTRLVLEAEAAQLSPPLRVARDGAAGGGLHLEVEEGMKTAAKPSDSSSGAAVLRFQVPQAGLYNLWARTLARHTGEDSFWIRVNGGRWIRWNAIPTGSSWRWSMVHDADRQREVAQFRLQPGENTIEIAAREAGAKLDRLLVTDDPLFSPDAPADE